MSRRSAKPEIDRAAIELFNQLGIDATTTREIASSAGVSEGAIYSHYSGKEDLAESLFISIHNEISLLLIGAASEGHSLRGQVEAVVSAYCGFADGDWSACSYHLLNLNRFLKSDTARDDDPVSLAEALVENLIEHGRIPPGDPSLLAAMSLGIVTQAAQNRIYNRLPGAFSEHKHAFVTAIMAVLQTR